MSQKKKKNFFLLINYSVSRSKRYIKKTMNSNKLIDFFFKLIVKKAEIESRVSLHSLRVTSVFHFIERSNICSSNHENHRT
ncbi:hypothetical protein M0811_10573 [Anaeramoeba ignava]|uniref:Uncharacterized protein n=1 Tax=Anaeramoeba ignava TaxID=1746090 RepID=A0A9Q0LEV0_ANAIG|nr:hypothetical protein M0811_10573 [Anaeramoeba ignava]